MWGFNFVAPLAVARACAHSPERHSMKTLRSILCSLALGIGWCIPFLDYDDCLANIIFSKIEMKGFFGSLLVLTSLCYLKRDWLGQIKRSCNIMSRTSQFCASVKSSNPLISTFCMEVKIFWKYRFLNILWQIGNITMNITKYHFLIRKFTRRSLAVMVIL